MIISKEERAKLRAECQTYCNVPSSTDYKITRLLNALDTAEARTEKAEKALKHEDGFSDLQMQKYSDAMERVEQLEIERDVLLEIIAEEACPYKEGQCIKTTDPDPSPETLCRPCWQEWLEKNGREEGAS